MVVGMFTDSYLPSHDGVATSVAFSAKELEKLGHEVYIVAPNHPHYKDKKNVYRILSVRLFKEPEIWMGLDLPEPSILKVSTMNFDIIHGHSGGPVSLIGWQLAQIKNIPFIETYHTMWKHYLHYFPFYFMWRQWMLNQINYFFGNDCDGLIAPSEKTKNELKRSGVTKPIYIVPSGINFSFFSHQTKGYLHQKLNIPTDTKLLLTVGRLEKEKSTDFLIKSFKHLIASASTINYAFIIVGEGRDSSQLKQLVLKEDVADKVYFVGALDYHEMPKIYSGADLFIFASQTETQGIAILESLASGTPVIAVKDSAYTEIIKDGENGFLIKKDEKIFSDKIRQVLADDLLMHKLHTQAKDSISNFSAKNTAAALEKVYQELIYQKNGLKTTFVQDLFTQITKKFLQKSER